MVISFNDVKIIPSTGENEISSSLGKIGMVGSRVVMGAFIIFSHNSEDKVIGQLYFSQQEPKHLMTWKIGYRISPKYQNQGYGSEAAQALVDYPRSRDDCFVFWVEQPY